MVPRTFSPTKSPDRPRRQVRDNGRPHDRRHDRAVESLERRTLLSVAATAETLVNISKFRGNQTEGTIAIDPTNPNRLFMSSNTGEGRDPDLGPNDVEPNSVSLFGAISTDAGVTWTTREFATGADGLPAACCDPSAEFDSFGNLWFTYLATPPGQPTPQPFHVFVLRSVDGGATFTVEADLGTQDQPTIEVGPGSVWVTWRADTGLAAAGAAVTGLGASGPFSAPEIAPGSDGNFGDIAVGPNGQVLIVYQNPAGAPQAEGPSQVFAQLDPDGLGPEGFGPPVLVTDTNVGGFDLIPAQNRRSVDAEANLAWDRSGGPFNGRLYMSYTDEPQFESSSGNNSDLDVYVRFSDDNGAHWSQRQLVNDDVGIGAPLPRAQFLPQIALDQSTGNIAIGFHDARNDTAVDRNPNDDVQFFVAIGQPDPVNRQSIVFAPNVRVGIGQSDARFADNGIDFGDYTGMAFYGNNAYPTFADNSNSTRDNPAGARRSFDMYTGRVHVTDTTVPNPPQVTPSSPLSPTVIKENSLIHGGRFYNLTVSYTPPAGATIDLATPGDNDLTVTGPAGFTAPMTLRSLQRKRKGQTVLARYRVAAPGADGKFDSSDNGLYTITLNADAVRASNGTATAAGVLSKFLVSVKPRKSSGRALELPSAAVVAAAADATGSDHKKDDDAATCLLTA